MSAILMTGARHMREEVTNRLIIWQTVLRNARTYLSLAEHLETVHIEHWTTVELYQGCDSRINVGLVAQQGLHESALVGFRQVFTTGNAGPGFADNHAPDIQQIRARMEQHVMSQLHLTKEDFRRLLGQFRDQRNERIAHYDGKTADYRQPHEFVR